MDAYVRATKWLPYMAIPLFSAGQRVSVMGKREVHAPGGIYKIIRALPSDGGPIRYRMKSEGETFERIVDEASLEHVQYD
jgi:hypothetical protein